MTANLDLFPPAIIPTMRYRDVPRAIDWLCDAFGFEKHLVIDEDDGGVAYAELSIGASMIMVGPAEGSAFDRLMKQPDQIGGMETQICYLYVADVDRHRERALAAGAEIVLDMDAEGSAGRGYSCRDPEGHIWNFGTYNPWHELGPVCHTARKHRTLLLSSLLLLLPVALGLTFGVPDQGLADRQGATFSKLEPKEALAAESDGELRKELARLRAAKDVSERALRTAEDQLASEQKAHFVADRSLQEAQEQLAKQRATTASIGSGDRPREDLERERDKRVAAERTLQDMREELQRALKATDASQKSLTELEGQLAKANAGRQAAERQLAEAAGAERQGQGLTGERHKARGSSHARATRYRLARAAARARVRRLREAREPFIKPPLPYF